MSNKDLINLGYSPDSGTGDSARRGGEKINNLFADIYTQFGDNPVGQDPSQPFYGYRRPFYEYEYKVGELHPAGRFIKINFKTPSNELAYDSEWGWGYDATGNIVDTDGDGIPDIYRDSEWYFLSRGEKIDADLSEVDSERKVHFVLPLAIPGDQIIIRDGLSTWKKNIFLNIWTTPYEFQSVDQVLEWRANTKFTQGLGYPDSETISIFSPTDGAKYRSNWHKVSPSTSVQSSFQRLAQPFAVSRTTNPFQGLSPTYYQNITRYQLEFLFTSYEEGWLVRLVVLDAADLSAVIQQLSNRLDGVDSDLDKGLYVSADSDVRYTVPIFRRTTDGREIHGTLSLRGDNDSIMTTIDSEDTPLINNPRSLNGGDVVQPLTTTVRFKLRDSIKVKDNVTVGNNLLVGERFQIGTFDADLAAVFVDSEIMRVNTLFRVHNAAQFDSDVGILGQLTVAESSIFNSDVRIEGNLFVGGDATVIETESLRVKDNIITLSKDANNAPVTDTGLIFQRYDRSAGVNGNLTASNTVYNTTMVWNEANDKFKFGETVSSDSDQTIAFEKTYFTIARDLVEVNNDLTMGGRLQIENTFVVDSDLLAFKDSEGTDILSLKRETLSRAFDEGDQSKNINDNTEYTLRLKGNAVFGKDSDDVVVFNSRIMSNMVPYGHEIYNLGDSDNAWKDLYLAGNTIYLGSVKISNEFDSIIFRDSDDKVINLITKEVSSTNVQIDSELRVGGNSLLLGELKVQERAQFDSDVNVKGSILTNSIKAYDTSTVPTITFHDDVIFRENVIMDSDVIIGADLRIDSDLIVKGTASFGQEVTFGDDVLFLDNAIFDSDVLIRGGLTVNGATTFVNSNNLQVFDNFIVLNKGQATPFNDTGLIFTRYDSDNVSTLNYNAVFEWDETTNSFLFGETNSSGLISNPSVTEVYFSVGNAPVATAPFVIDVSGNSDPGGAPDGYSGGPRPTLTGNGVVDGGTF